MIPDTDIFKKHAFWIVCIFILINWDEINLILAKMPDKHLSSVTEYLSVKLNKHHSVCVLLDTIKMSHTFKRRCAIALRLKIKI